MTSKTKKRSQGGSERDDAMQRMDTALKAALKTSPASIRPSRSANHTLQRRISKR